MSEPVLPFETAGTGRYVQVALNLPLRREFTYSLPEGATARPGNRVLVQFHGRKLGGVVVAVSDTCDLPPQKVRSVEKVLDSDLLLPDSLMRLGKRMADSYGCSLGEALDAALFTAPEVRKAEYARLGGKDRRFIKGQKYTLLSHRENLTLEGRQSLKTLLAANKRLNTAYLLKESFGQLWDYEREGWARRFFENWRASLRWQRLEPYEKFAEMIDRHWDGIAAYCKPENKVSLGFVEGLNNKIRVIQRRAYGLRDEEYLRLKILTCMLPAL